MRYFVKALTRFQENDILIRVKDDAYRKRRELDRDDGKAVAYTGWRVPYSFV
jgi:hypothetical protein